MIKSLKDISAAKYPKMIVGKRYRKTYKAMSRPGSTDIPEETVYYVVDRIVAHTNYSEVFITFDNGAKNSFCTTSEFHATSLSAD